MRWPNLGLTNEGYRAAPLVDALARGALPKTGRCLEVGSGTGILTSYLQEAWTSVICVDLSMMMMRRSPSRRQVQADARTLPFPNSAFDVIVIGDAPLFTDEVERLLTPTGR